MKAKFEIKSTSASQPPKFTIFMENKSDGHIEFKVTMYNVRQGKFGDDARQATAQDLPISDGTFSMSKENMKRFIPILQALLKQQ